MNNNDFNNYNAQNDEGGDGYPYAYQSYMEVKSKSRSFAVASFILGIASIVCCCITYVGLAMAVMSIVFAIVSKKKMGYFDPLALIGLILGIIGAVFGLTSIVMDLLTRAGYFDSYLEEMLEEYYKELENLENGSGNNTTSGF